MAKLTDDLVKDLESEEYDVLDDIQSEDFVFVINPAGQLKGISFPETFTDDDNVDPAIEEIIEFLIDKYKEVRPPNATLH
jgi:hypothetical protein